MEKALETPEGSALKRFATGLASSFDPRGLIQFCFPQSAVGKSSAPWPKTAEFLLADRSPASGRPKVGSWPGKAWDEGKLFLGSARSRLAGAIDPARLALASGGIAEQIGSGDVAGGAGSGKVASVVPAGALAGGAGAQDSTAALKRSAKAQYGQALPAGAAPRATRAWTRFDGPGW